ncbi:MAG: site-specific integrase [Actinomycetota bacterium]
MVAYVEERKNGYLVVWREAETGKKTSRLLKWGGDPNTLGGVTTKEEARRYAEAFSNEKRKAERAYLKPLQRAIRQNAQDYPEGHPARRTEYIDEGEDQLRFENYVGSLIDGGAITDSAKHTYRHTLQNHIEGTKLGRTNVRFIEPEDIEQFWNSLDVGDGAKRNIAQVLRKGFTRALRRGLIEVNPMTRADLEVPSKRRRVRGPIQVLEPEEVAELAEAASTDRDRLIVKVMGYGGLRAGECGGLRRRDLVRRDAYCELRLHQQVIRVGREKKVTALKTDSAQRSVPIPCQLVDEIEAFLKDNPPAEDGRIFHGPNGELIAAQGVNNAVQRTARRAGLGSVNSHLLRHTAASMWFDDGMDAESVRRALGHTDIKTTLGLYAHMLKGGAAKLADSMARRMAAG